MSISDKLIALNTTKQDIKQAITDKGVDMTDVPFTDYAEKIDEISTGGSGEWEPNPIWNWWDIEQIIKDDVQAGFQYKVIELIPDSFPVSSLTGTGVSAYKTSDGAYYTGSPATHTWDESKDRQAYDDYENPTYKTRWIIRYYSTENITFSFCDEVLYFVADGVKFDGGTENGIGRSSVSETKKCLMSFKLINGANLRGTSLEYMFSTCYSLQSIPELNTGNVRSMARMFYNCHSLQSIPELNTENVIDMGYVFNTCYSLVTSPLKNLNTNLTIATTSYETFINRESLLYIIRNRSGTDPITLTIGATNMAKLTPAEIAEATNVYNITLA